MWYYEHAQRPETRNGSMVPRSALLDIYNRPDSGYCTVYGFSSEAAFAIRAQGHSQGLARFPVFADRLWIDIDAASSAPEHVAAAQETTRAATRQLVEMGASLSVWDSGSKGFHICVKTEPMFDKSVPYSHLLYVRDTLNIVSDFSLFQAGRLLSNPGRLHPKTGRKKTKVFEHAGHTLLQIPLVPAPDRPEISSDALTDSDLARIGYSRLSALIQDGPLVTAGTRHTRIWSLASSLLEAGMSIDLVFANCLYANGFLAVPKPPEEVKRAVDQAAQQLGLV